MSNSDVEVCISFGENGELRKYMCTIPRVGDTIKIKSKQYKVIEVVWNIHKFSTEILIYTEPKA